MPNRGGDRDRTPGPKPPPGGALDYEALAAAPNDRTFYVEYQATSANLRDQQVWILSFSLTSSGSVTPLTMVKGGVINNQPAGLQTWGNLAVSPDGTRLAFTVNSSNRVPALSAGYSDKIIVIDLRTGQRAVWDEASLFFRPGQVFSIPRVLGRRRAVPGLPHAVVRSPGTGHLLRRHARARRIPRYPGRVAQHRFRRRLAGPRPGGATRIGAVSRHRTGARRPPGFGPLPWPCCPAR